MENLSAFVLTELGLAVLAAYLLPTLVELWRGHPRRSIVWLNVLTGWTVVGWALALVLALAGPRAPHPPRTTSPSTRPTTSSTPPPVAMPRP
jgi:hypothetical protein